MYNLNNYWQYSTVNAAKLAGSDNYIIVSYGKKGLTKRQKESKNSFVLVPKSTLQTFKHPTELPGCYTSKRQ